MVNSTAADRVNFFLERQIKLTVLKSYVNKNKKKKKNLKHLKIVENLSKIECFKI